MIFPVYPYSQSCTAFANATQLAWLMLAKTYLATASCIGRSPRNVESCNMGNQFTSVTKQRCPYNDLIVDNKHKIGASPRRQSMIAVTHPNTAFTQAAVVSADAYGQTISASRTRRLSHGADFKLFPIGEVRPAAKYGQFIKITRCSHID
jgi:hypothetical protein